MAGPWYSNSGPGDALIAVAPRVIQLALSDAVKNKAIMGHPVIVDLMARDAMMGQLLGASGVSVGLLTAGTGKLAATSEGTPASATDFSLSNSATVTPARLAYARRASDFGLALNEALLTGQIGPNLAAVLVYDALAVYVNKLVDLLVATATSATYSIGTSGTGLSWSAINEGVIDMKSRGVAGSGLALVTAGQAKALMADMLGLGGAIQWSTMAQQGIQQLPAGAYLGSLNGLDFYLNGELDTSGGDDYGIVLTPGSHLLKHQRVPLGMGAQVVGDLGFVTLEARRPGGGISDIEFVSHFGVGILEQVRYAAVISKT